MSYPGARRQGPSLLAAASGASGIEHVLAICCVALVAVGAWSALGGEVEQKTDCVARAIAAAGGVPCGASRAASARAALENVDAAAREQTGSRLEIAGAREGLESVEPRRWGAGMTYEGSRAVVDGESQRLVATTRAPGDAAPAPSPWDWVEDNVFEPIGDGVSAIWNSSPVDVARGFAVGAYQGARDLIASAVKLVWSANGWFWNSGFHPFDLRPDKLTRMWDTTTRAAAGVWHAITHPGETWDASTHIAGALWDGVIDWGVRSWDTLLHGSAHDKGHLIGRVAFEIAATFVPVTKLPGVSRVARVFERGAGVADDVGRLSEDAARVVTRADRVGQALLPTGVDELSARLETLRSTLEADFGIRQVYVGGGSARAVLDSVYRGRTLEFRDLDIIAVAGREVDAQDVEAIGKALESAGLGKYSPRDLRPRPRANPALTGPARDQYNAGWGVHLFRDAEDLDFSLYHHESDLELNGLFKFDRVMIPLEEGRTIERLARYAERTPYEELVRRGLVVDRYGGYGGWLRGEAAVVNWEEIARDPIQNTIRVVRSLAKTGHTSIPTDIASRLRTTLLEAESTNRLQVTRNLLKLLEDHNAALELKMLAETPMLRDWQPGVARWVEAHSVADIERSWRRMSPGTPTRGPPSVPLGRVQSLAESLPPAEQLALLSDVALYERAFAAPLAARAANRIVGEYLPASRVSEEWVGGLLEAKAGKVSLDVELRRIAGSEAFDEATKADLVARSIVRRVPAARREAVISQLRPEASAAERARLLAMARERRIGYFTGVFNPFHRSHHDLVRHAIDDEVLDELYVIPTLRTSHNEVPVRWEDRLAMAREGLADLPEARVVSARMRSTFANGGTGAIVQTLVERPSGLGARWVHVMGADSFERYAAEGYMRTDPAREIFVVARPGTTLRELSAGEAERVTMSSLPIRVYGEQRRSSTIVRERLAANESIRGLVPAAVERYIRAHRLYRIAP